MHQLARDVVDGSDVVGIDCVAQTEPIGHQGRAKQHRLTLEGHPRPEPDQRVECDQQRVDADDTVPDGASDDVHDCSS